MTTTTTTADPGKQNVLDNYFKEWPTDDQAANATDADYWARFGL